MCGKGDSYDRFQRQPQQESGSGSVSYQTFNVMVLFILVLLCLCELGWSSTKRHNVTDMCTLWRVLHMYSIVVTVPGDVETLQRIRKVFMFRIYVYLLVW